MISEDARVVIVRVRHVAQRDLTPVDLNGSVALAIQPGHIR